MRAVTVIGIVMLAGLAWVMATAEEVPTGSAARLPNGRYSLEAAAVARTLDGAGLAVRAEQVELPGALTAAVAAPTLRVGGAELRGDGALIVRLRCGVAAECLPFFAEVKMAGRQEAMAAVERLRFAGAASVGSASAGELSGRSSVADISKRRGVQGVALGAHVQLQLADAQMRIVLPGIAMDTGTPGAEVRVTSLDRKRTYRGVVVDAATVKGGVE